MKNHLEIFFRGIARIMGIHNPWSGLLLLLAVVVHSIFMAIGLIIGTFASMVCGLLLNDNSRYKEGGYGYNGALVGVALTFYLPFSFPTILLIFVGGAISSCLMYFISQKNTVSPYTAPFVIASWLALFIAHVLLLQEKVLPLPIERIDPLQGMLLGVSQVMFLENILSSLIMIIAIALASPKQAMWALIGSCGGFGCALLFFFPKGLISLGLFGFNSCLAAMVLSEIKPTRLFKPVLGILSAVLLTRLFQELSLPPLTAPFVISTWLILLL